MSIEKNKDLVLRIVRDFINKNDPSVVDDMFAEDFVNHNPSAGVSPDREGLKQMFRMVHTAFPDYRLEVEDLIAEGDKVAIRLRATGTHKGPLMSIEPTGKSFNTISLGIIRIHDLKVKERWNVSNDLELMRQLGLM